YFCFGVPGGLFEALQLQFVVGAVGGETPDEYYVVCREVIDDGGTPTPDDTFADVAHADARWLRFRHTGTTVFWETSPDRETWTIRRQKTPTFTPSAGRVKLGAFNFTGNGTEDAVFDNVNGGTSPSEDLEAAGTLGVVVTVSGSA